MNKIVIFSLLIMLFVTGCQAGNKMQKATLEKILIPTAKRPGRMRLSTRLKSKAKYTLLLISTLSTKQLTRQLRKVAAPYTSLPAVTQSTSQSSLICPKASK